MQNPKKDLRSIRVGKARVPDVFVGLDDDTAVVSFDDISPLEVWDLATRKRVRKFEGKGFACHSMINLSHGRIAVGWRCYRNSRSIQSVVAVFDAATGKLLQELTGCDRDIYGLALVEDHLLTMCGDKTLRVWSQDAVGKVRRSVRVSAWEGERMADHREA